MIYNDPFVSLVFLYIFRKLFYDFVLIVCFSYFLLEENMVICFEDQKTGRCLRGIPSGDKNFTTRMYCTSYLIKTVLNVKFASLLKLVCMFYTFTHCVVYEIVEAYVCSSPRCHI